MANEKKLTMKAVKSDVARYDQTERIYFDDDYYLDIYPYFEPLKINNMIEVFQDDIQTFIEHDIEISNDILIPFLNFSIIKYFSNLYVPDNPEKYFDYFLTFIKSKYYTEIMNHMLDEELVRVYNQVIELFELASDMVAKNDELRKEVDAFNEKHPDFVKAIQAVKEAQNES